MIKHIAVTCVLVLLSCSAFAAPVTTLPIRSMYVLGDSLSDQGNLLAATTALGGADPATGPARSGALLPGTLFQRRQLCRCARR